MLLRAALVLIGLPLLLHGAEGLYVALANRSLEELSCDDYVSYGAPRSWVRITGCQLDYLNAGYRDAADGVWQRVLPASGFRVSELLFPARPRGTASTAPVHLVVATRDPAVLAIAERTFAGSGNKDQESFLVTMLQVVTAMRAAQQIDGMLRRPIAMLASRGSLSAIQAPLADDVAVLDLHERPGALRPGLEVAGGLSALSLAMLLRRRARKTVATKMSGPQLLLLNLPFGASMNDIEHAPPLGTQDEVRSLIVMSLPGIAFDDTGRGTFTVFSGSVEVDVRTEDPVHTAVVTVRGAAAPAVARLLDETGWLAYAPKVGVFVSQRDLRPAAPKG